MTFWTFMRGHPPHVASVGPNVSSSRYDDNSGDAAATQPLVDPVQITSIQSLDGLSVIEQFWRRSNQHPNADYDQFRAVCSSRPCVDRPYVLVLGSCEEPTALLVGRLERRGLAPAVAYFRPFRLRCRVLEILHNGLIGDVSEHEADAVVERLWSALRAGECDAIQVHHLPEHSPLMLALARSRIHLCRHMPTKWSLHRALSLSGADDVVMSRKHRKSLRKREADLDAAYPGAVAWRWVTALDTVDILSAYLERVARLSYQRALGSGFIDDEEHQQRLQAFAGRGLLRVMLLELNGEPRAFWIGIVYKRVFHSWATAFDPTLRRFEPGNLVFHKMVEHLRMERVERFDFGLGDAFYKQRFADTVWRERMIRLFSPRLRGTVLAGVFAAADGVSKTALRLLAEAHVLTLKTKWRRALSKRLVRHSTPPPR